MASAIDANRSWIAKAISKLDEDRRQEVDTPLLALSLPELPLCRIYIKDETAHPTGS
jgi:cysteine synthase A